jgi:hypothetical protein
MPDATDNLIADLMRVADRDRWTAFERAQALALILTDKTASKPAWRSASFWLMALGVGASATVAVCGALTGNPPAAAAAARPRLQHLSRHGEGVLPRRARHGGPALPHPSLSELQGLTMVRVLMVKLPDRWTLAQVEATRGQFIAAVGSVSPAAATELGPEIAALEGGYCECTEASWLGYHRAYKLRSGTP